MKNTNLLQLVAVLFLFVYVSCEQEESFKTEDILKGTLSFGSSISKFNFNSEKNWLSDDVPACKTELPKYVKVSLKHFNESSQQWEWYENSNVEKIVIEVNPNGTDTNSDGLPDSWFTKESLDLELNAGEYSLEYFAVTNSSEDSAEILHLAPRKPENTIDPDLQPVLFHNFVETPLPIKITIDAGVKYYQSVEVLCYDDSYSFNFGYLFFDFNSENLKTICVYGNFCLKNDRHVPAQFKIKVWRGNSFDDINLLVSAENKMKSFIAEDGSTQYYSEAICFPLPDIPSYSAKIWLVEEDETDLLIRQGTFNVGDLDALLSEENGFSYYHFREGCCDLEDNFSLLTDLTVGDQENCEEPEDPPIDEECSFCDSNDAGSGKVREITFKYIGSENIVLSVTYKGASNNFTPIDEKSIVPGDEIVITGAYNHTSHGQIIGNNLKFEIDNHPDEGIHTSCSEPLYLGLRTDLGNSTDNGSFEIIQIEMSNGDQCPLTPD